MHNATYPNVTENKETVLKPLNTKEIHNPAYSNIIEKQRDTVLKPSHTKEIHNPTYSNITEKQRDCFKVIKHKRNP